MYPMIPGKADALLKENSQKIEQLLDTVLWYTPTQYDRKKYIRESPGLTRAFLAE